MAQIDVEIGLQVRGKIKVVRVEYRVWDRASVQQQRDFVRVFLTQVSRSPARRWARIVGDQETIVLNRGPLATG